MAGALKRLHRLRYLTEEQARLELVRETQQLRQAQAVRTGAVLEERQRRDQLANSYMPWTPKAVPRTMDGNAEQKEKDWLLAEAALEFSSLERMQLEKWCVEEAERVAPLTKRYQAARLELRQVEILLEKQANVERMEQGRRDQAEADAWYQTKSLRQQQKTRKQQRPAPFRHRSMLAKGDF
jgi:hypothetical protein